MLGNLLKKILPKKKEKALITGRDLYGRNNVGYPTIQISREIDDIIQKQYRLLRPLIKFYKETLFFKWLPSIISNSLSDEQLEKLSGRNVQMVYLLLFRDMLRHVAQYVTPRHAQPKVWADLFAQDVLDKCRMLSDSDDQDVAKKQALFDTITIADVDDPAVVPVWMESAAELIHIPKEELYRCHFALMATIMKKLKKKKKLD